MAADLWEQQLFECRFGGIRLDVQSTEDQLGRVVVTHQIPHLEGAPVRDQGAEPRTTRCRIIFFPLDEKDDPRERFYFFQAKVAEGRTQTFTHPITGSYRAKCGPLTLTAAAEPRETLMVECTFHEDSDTPAAFESGAGAPAAAGTDEVRAASADLDAGLVEVNDELLADDPDAEPLSTTVGTDCVTAATGWEDAAASADDGITARRVNLELVALSDSISRETDRLELALHPERWPIARALANLHYSIRRASEAVVRETPRLAEVTLLAATSVYALAARTYPGEPFEARAEQILNLNDIPNPARIEAGTRLKVYARDTSGRLKSPRLSGASL